MAKKANGEGSITKRKDGTFMVRYTVQSEVGSKRKTIYAKSKTEARQRLTEALAERDKGIVLDGDNQSLQGYMKAWLKDNVKVTTYASYEQLTRLHIIPSIGSTKLKNLKPVPLQRLYKSKLDSGLSARTAQYIHAVIHKALKDAMRWEMVSRNVADAVSAPRVRKKEIRATKS